MTNRVNDLRPPRWNSTWLQTSAIIRCMGAAFVSAALWLLVALVLGWW